MPVGNVRQYPYFVRLFHTSTPLRSVELRMKKESRDLVASAGHWHGDPHFLLLFYHLLDLLHQCTKFHLQSMLGSFTRESP